MRPTSPEQWLQWFETLSTADQSMVRLMCGIAISSGYSVQHACLAAWDAFEGDDNHDSIADQTFYPME